MPRKNPKAPSRGAFASRKNLALFDAAIAAGWACVLLGNGHVQCTNPANGHVFDMSVTMPESASRAWKNNRAKARRAGLDVWLDGTSSD